MDAGALRFDASSLTVKQLKARLEAAGLPTDGRKAALVERLQAHADAAQPVEATMATATAHKRKRSEAALHGASAAAAAATPADDAADAAAAASPAGPRSLGLHMNSVILLEASPLPPRAHTPVRRTRSPRAWHAHRAALCAPEHHSYAVHVTRGTKRAFGASARRLRSRVLTTYNRGRCTPRHVRPRPVPQLHAGGWCREQYCARPCLCAEEGQGLRLRDRRTTHPDELPRSSGCNRCAAAKTWRGKALERQGDRLRARLRPGPYSPRRRIHSKN